MTRTTSIEWPEDVLGCPLLATYKVDVVPMFTRTAIAEHPPLFRRARHDEKRVCAMEFIWTLEQMQAFEDFIEDDLGGGLAGFMMKQTGGGTMVPMYCQFSSPIAQIPVQDRTDRYRVTFSVDAFWRIGKWEPHNA